MRQIIFLLFLVLVLTEGKRITEVPPDCSHNILVCHALDASFWAEDVKAEIAATGRFCLDSIDTVSVQSATPTLEHLSKYRAVLIFADFGFANATALGDVLADYVEQYRGGVVSAAFTAGGGDLCLEGRWTEMNYNPMTCDSFLTTGPETLGLINQPSHFILSNVSSFDGGLSSYRTTGDPVPNAEVIAYWSDGLPLVTILGNNTASGIPIQSVYLNFFPPSNNVREDLWVNTTDGYALLANTLQYAMRVPSPPAPTGVSIVSVTATSAVISWTPVPVLGVVGYQVQYAVKMPLTYTAPLVWTSVEVYGGHLTSSATLTGMEPDLKYLVRVASISEGHMIGDPIPTPIIVLTVPEAPAFDAMPGPTSDSLFLTWETLPSLNAPIVQYVFTYTNLVTQETGTVAVAGNFTSTTIHGLAAATDYSVTATAANSAGVSLESAPIVSSTACASPTSVNITAVTSDSVTVHWCPPPVQGDDVVVDYVVRMQHLEMNDPQPLVARTGAPPQHPAMHPTPYAAIPDVDGSGCYSTTLTELSSGSIFSIQVAAVGAAPEQLANGTDTSLLPMGAYSAPLTVVTLPNAPTDLSATTLNSTSVRVAWSPPNPNGNALLTGYTISYQLDTSSPSLPPCAPDALSGSVTISTITRFTVLSGLCPGSKFELTVSAINVAGTGVESNIVEAYTVPSAPSNVAASGTSIHAMQASWNAPSPAGSLPVVSYILQYRPVPRDTDLTDPEIANLPGYSEISLDDASTQYSIIGLGVDTLYEVRVAAVNRAGTGDWSASILSASLAPPPTAVHVSNVYVTNATVSWVEPGFSYHGPSTAPVLGYLVQYAPVGSTEPETIAVNGTTMQVALLDLDCSSKYTVCVSTVNAGGTGACSTPVIFATEIGIGHVSIVSCPTTVFPGAPFHLQYELSNVVPDDMELGITLEDSRGNMGGVTLRAGDHAAEIQYIVAPDVFTSTANGADIGVTSIALIDLTTTLSGRAESFFVPPPTITLQVVPVSQTFVVNAPTAMVVGQTSEVLFSLGVPVPERGSVTVIVTITPQTQQQQSSQAQPIAPIQLTFSPGEAVQVFALSATSSMLGTSVVSFALDGVSAHYYLPPLSFAILVTTPTDISVVGLDTTLFTQTLTVVNAYLGAPLPYNGNLTMIATTDDGFEASMQFANNAVMSSFPFNLQSQPGVHTISFALHGDSANLFIAPPPFQFYVLQRNSDTQITLQCSIVSMFDGTLLPAMLDIHNPVPAGRTLIIDVHGSDGGSTQLIFNSTTPVTQPVMYIPHMQRTADLTLKFLLSGTAFGAYVPPPSLTVQVVAHASQVTLLGTTTQMILGQTQTVRIDLGVPVPFTHSDADMALPDGTMPVSSLGNNTNTAPFTFVVHCTNDMVKYVPFQAGQVIGSFDLEAGNVVGEYIVSFEFKGPAARFYDPLPVFGLSVMTEEQMKALLAERAAATHTATQEDSSSTTASSTSTTSTTSSSSSVDASSTATVDGSSSRVASTNSTSSAAVEHKGKPGAKHHHAAHVSSSGNARASMDVVSH